MRLALLHGFTQTGRSWAPIDAELRALGHEVVTPDMAGHGGQPALDLRGDAARLAADIGPAVWVGYSMGGRVALHVALEHPTAVLALVVVSTTAGIDDATERQARRDADEVLAASVEAMGVATFVDRWLDGPLWATLPVGARGVDARLANSAAGLAASLRLAGTGTQRPMWAELDRISVPALVVSGALDPKFSHLGDRLAASIGANAVRVTMQGAGHAAPWEQPDAFVGTVDNWLLSQ